MCLCESLHVKASVRPSSHYFFQFHHHTKSTSWTAAIFAQGSAAASLEHYTVLFIVYGLLRILLCQLCPAASSLAEPGELSLTDEAPLSFDAHCMYPEDGFLSSPWNLDQQWGKKMAKVSRRQWQGRVAKIAKPSRVAQKSDMARDRQVGGLEVEAVYAGQAKVTMGCCNQL